MKSLLGALLLCAAVAFAQGTTALLNGTVVDPTGAAVPGAEVTVTNVDTGLAVKTATNEKGEYAFPSMPSGNYKAGVTKAGFKGEVKTGIEINSGVDATRSEEHTS